MTEEPFLRGLVVIGRHEQRAVTAELLRLDRERDGFGRGIRARATDDLAASRRGFDREFDDAVVFRVVERGGFAGRPDRDDPGDAAGDLAFDQAGKGRFIDPVIFKGRDERRVGACKHRACGSKRERWP